MDEGIVAEGFEGEGAVSRKSGVDQAFLVRDVGRERIQDRGREGADREGRGPGAADDAHRLDNDTTRQVVDLAGVRQVDDGDMGPAVGDGGNDVS